MRHSPIRSTRTAWAGVVVRVILVAGLILGSALAGGIAAAAPGDRPPALDLQEIGSGQDPVFRGLQRQVSLSLPVPDGMSPTALRGTVSLPPFVTGGIVDVTQGDRLISRTPISTAPNSPITLPLPGVRVEQRAVDLELHAYLQVSGTCRFDPENAFRITDTDVEYAGADVAPASVADFLPPALRALTIYVPDDVSEPEGAAAINLATAVVAQYGTAEVRMTTEALPRANLVPVDRPGALERQIVVSSSAPNGVTLQPGPNGPYLTIGGPPAQLIAQTRLLTSSLEPISLSSSAVAGQLFDAPQLPPKVRTLADLGVADQSVQGLNWPSVSIGIDQTRLGRPSKNVRVQLMGTYTPAPQAASSMLSVHLGDKVIDTWPADESGRYNRWVTIPDSDLARFVNLTLTLSRGDVGSQCGDGYQSSLTLDSAGEVSSDPADPPIPSGFGSLPQVLMPRMQLGMTIGDVADVARAVAVMSGLQRLAAAPIGVDVAPVNDILSSTQPGVVIAANGSGVPQLSLPVYTDGRTVRVVDADGRTSEVTLTPGLMFGSLQVLRDDNRSLLVATSTNVPADLDDALSWLGADPTRWPNLSGQAMIKVAGREPVFVAQPVQPQQESGPSTVTTLARVLGVLAAVGLLIGGLVFIRTRLRRAGTK